MKRTCICSAVIFSFLTSSAPPAAGQQRGAPSPEQIARMRQVGLIRSTVGNSGLRRFLSESASLGELRNRAASYRIIEQVEGARAASLEARIAGLQGALDDPTLPPAERERLRGLVDDARTELATIPSYRAHYHTSTGQAGSLAQLAFIGDNAVFAFIKGRIAWRSDPDELLGVRTGMVELAPVVFPTPDLFFAVGFTVGYTDVEVLAFDGTSSITAAGLRMDVGAALGPHWALGVHADHVWATGSSDVIRPGPEPVSVQRESTTRTISGKVELMGRFGRGAIGWLPGFLEVAPRAGAYVMRTGYDPSTDNLGHTSTGVFGDSDALALVAAGLALDFDAGGRFAPALYVGLDHEFPGEMSDVLGDRAGIVLAGGLAYVIAPSKRVSLGYTFGRSTGGRRQSGEVDLVGVIDF